MKQVSAFPLSAAEAKEQLVLRCTLDRLQLKLLVKKTQNPPDNPITRTLAMVENALTFGQYVPGISGGWARFFRSATSIARKILS